MWPRKQIDIGWADLAAAVAHVLRWRVPAGGDVISSTWMPAAEALVCLSVRSAWDLLLASLRLPERSEVILSAVTVADMARIIDHHGLVPVPVAVDPDTLAPALADLERAISPRTRVILVAHLFGSRVEMAPIVELARSRGLLLVEDCAQAYDGAYAGHSASDAALFSFGPIKTSTALGGAVARVRDPALRAEMLRRQREHPVQSRWSYLARLGKYAGIRLLSARPAYTAVVRCCEACGLDFDRRIAGMARSFPADRLFECLRRRPSAPLLWMLRRRLSDPTTAARLARRTARARRLIALLPPRLVIGAANPTHTFWVLPIRACGPGAAEDIVGRLRRAGFDATRRSSMVAVERPASVAGSAETPHWLNEVVFLPNGEAMPDAELSRMGNILRELGGASEAPAPEAPALMA